MTRCEDYDDLIQTAHLLAYASSPTANGVAVVSHSGGISSLIADHLGHAGIILPPLSENAEAGLNDILSGLAGQPIPPTSPAWPAGRSLPTFSPCWNRNHRRGRCSSPPPEPHPSRDCAGLEGANVKTSGLPFNGRRQHRRRAGYAERSPRARVHFPNPRRQVPG